MAFDNTIWDCGKHDVLFKRAVPDGKGGYSSQKLYRGAFVWAVDVDGNVCQIKTHNAAVNKAEHDPYAMRVKADKWRSGWVPIDGCPQNSQHAKWLRIAGIDQRMSCTAAIDGQPMGRGRDGNPHHCKCVDELITWRRGQAAIKAAAVDHKMTMMEEQLRATEKQTESLTSAAAASAKSSAEMAAAFAEFLKIHNAKAAEPSKAGK